MEISWLVKISKDSEFSQEIYKGAYFIFHTNSKWKKGLKTCHFTVYSIFFLSM